MRTVCFNLKRTGVCLVLRFELCRASKLFQIKYSSSFSDNRPYSCHRNISQLFLNNTKLSNLSILNDKLMIRKKTALFLPCHIQSLSTKNLNVLQIQGLIMGPKSMEMLSRKYGETVSELRIGGVCVHTSEKNQYWSSIGKF